ncbi:DUF1349 domain-containing protein [Bifidobacterium callimiconis]|uniref:DUF1349 domain-containing protein n=1 Tax=Bifidobacterium callimiconis TaxID=2306973 RepID=UPI001BDCEF9D|nr:DUF1349 domain-containing protein [Bifidobacterium callimiconis]MBT1176021.1 DUF1349 domain-containing protein [Bifidobacterium callimiconis]
MLQGDCRFDIRGNVLAMKAEPGRDFFVNPVDGSVIADAAFAYQPTEGDFICRAKVSLHHESKFDGGALFAYQDDTHWVKACFEQGDYGFQSVVTVVTNGTSDDCYGVTVPGDAVWLQLARTGDVFSIHYSFDGDHYFMSRLCSVPFDRWMNVGFEAQSPTGDGGERYFTNFTILNHRLADPRAGR